MKSIYAAAFALVIGISGVPAQGEHPAKIVSAGILNGRAVTMPKPEYPEAAKQAKIGGIVAVDVTVDESGAVSTAVAEIYDQHETRNADGTKGEAVVVDPALREAAELAARQATFKPLLLSGQAVKVSGKLMYNFIADNSNLPPRVGDIYGPLLNGKMVEMVQPRYPAEARAAGISGSVTVHVTIDENGNVISAEAISGPELLRAASEEAAMKARFQPALLAGQPTRIRGVLRYTFATTKRN